jgi:hypothetical protein
VRRAIVGALGLSLLSAVHPPEAVAQRARAAARIAVGRPTVPTAPAAPTGTEPDPRLGPDEVVGIVLEALAQADHQDDAEVGARDPASPFALVFAFSSPGNRAAAGSLERFEAMVRDDTYRPLVHHRRAARGAMRVDGERATQRVIVTSDDGQRVAYTFVLARQDAGTRRGCWLTESVTREAPSRLTTPFSA